MPFLLNNYTIMSNSWRMALPPQTILNAKATTWIGTTIPTLWFKHILVELSSASSANFTVKLQGAMWTWNLWKTAPTFSAAKTTANPWDYIQNIDYQNWSGINWDTWIAFAWTDDVRLLVYNVEWLDFINAEITAISAWVVTLRVRLFTND